jgi:hypothetical protein
MSHTHGMDEMTHTHGMDAMTHTHGMDAHIMCHMKIYVVRCVACCSLLMLRYCIPIHIQLDAFNLSIYRIQSNNIQWTHTHIM